MFWKYTIILLVRFYRKLLAQIQKLFPLGRNAHVQIHHFGEKTLYFSLLMILDLFYPPYIN
jgi:hypothetical protein